MTGDGADLGFLDARPPQATDGDTEAAANFLLTQAE